eukprot:TRINITY_DN4556_c0_g1_i1.p1 TRINITY_DN4556_c0_g1~~TRINITY_DN4556_c0_g1_i1.p1  ORF type:complete len:411 (+),score=104.24 TRINITY_DN4556_c0_g1_i1:380-1612(+)
MEGMHRTGPKNAKQKWLDFRMATPPTPQQCARLHKYQEEKYSIKEAGLQHLYEQEMQDPMSHRIRRYQEYVDQKWDVRRSRQIQKGTLGQKWLVKKSNSPDIRDKYYYTRWQAIWESKLFMQIDLLRPPRRQRVWKLEDDYRAVEAMNKIDNPDYKMNPFETTRQERYLSSPSHVAGRAVPTSVTKVEKAFDASKLPPEPVGELRMRITNENPIYGMSSDAEYQEWFADQRKQLIVARAELEQMKRDGFRPDEVGGDLDPYTAARPIDDYKEERRKRTEMLDRARDERQQLEAKKKGALQKMLGTDLKREYLASVAHKGPEEAVVYTKVRGKITEGESKRYLNEKHKLPETRSASLPATAIDDDSENMGEEMEGIRSVFGKKGTGLYSSKVGGRQSTRPDDASPDKTPEK